MHGEDGISADFEEVVGDADVVVAEDFTPDGQQGGLGWRAGFDDLALCATQFGLGQCTTVQLAVGQERQGIEHDK
ncbi:hypothetical protein, partial [Acetobacter senegalensis]|uniref:hypothetical protein n=1 Tax=Acetobacter senegalensis TaxID=446692 RepID=UPI001EDC755D